MHDPDDSADPERIPGLFRIWELTQLLKPDASYRIEAAGKTEHGAQLVAVYRYAAQIPGAGCPGGAE